MNQSPTAIANEQDAGLLLADLVLPEISDADVKRFAVEIDRQGFSVIPSYVGNEIVERLSALVTKIIERNSGEYAVLTGSTEISGTLLDTIGKTPQLNTLLRRVYAAGTGKTPPAQSLYQVLRCISGQTGLHQAYFFHYDSYVVTALLPILIPKEGRAGDLVMKPNTRRIRSSYLYNLFDKIIVDNKILQNFFKRQAIERRCGFKNVRVVPGNLYLFWGYRSLHANEPCDPKKIRATALFHFGDPHANNGLRKFTGRAKIRATDESAPF
ncbi:hypothetical protein [Acidocella aromatica]|uniref:Uncharacterized protein n=1 Tax=Acidocella aromatica TaxID=1303579 RepID=A0A840VRR9_9PROT|nr:hypothetical protein [Acidocella aromatica]MBB5374040.1 hypothetical protein [Acidocella aromatica]